MSERLYDKGNLNVKEIMAMTPGSHRRDQMCRECQIIENHFSLLAHTTELKKYIYKDKTFSILLSKVTVWANLV